MDRRLKERLVGATILVVLIVLVVPELLSGPDRAAGTPHAAAAGEPVRNVTMDIVTAKALPADAPAAGGAASAAPTGDDAVHGNVPDGPAQDNAGSATPGGVDETSPASGPDDAPRHRPAPTITTLGAQPGTAPVENATQPPKSVTSSVLEPRHGWTVQLGSFASKVNAEKLGHQLKAQGFPAFVSPLGTGNRLRYRVRVGPTVDRGAAEKMVARLKKDGHPGSTVPP